MENLIVLPITRLHGFVHLWLHFLKIRHLLICLLLFPGISSASAENVITSGTSFKVSPGTTVVSSANLVVKSGAILDNAGTLILKMDLRNEQPLPDSIGIGTVEFSGTANQAIIGRNIIRYLVVNNSAGVTMGGHTRVNGILTLTNGTIAIGDLNLVLGSTATIAGIPSPSVMIIATGSGKLFKEYPTGFSGFFTYPVGDDTGDPEYSPVTLHFTAGTFSAGNSVGVNLRNTGYPDPGITGNYLRRYWNISQSGISGFNCNATFQYLPSDVSGNESLISCTKVEPLPWVTYALTNAVTHTLTAQGIGSFGTFSGVKSTMPPVNQELVNITIPYGVTNCYDATQVLTVAGNGKTFLVENNGSVTLVAGAKISMLPGTKVLAGGYLHAYITSDGSYCGSLKTTLVANQAHEEITVNETIHKSMMIKIYPNPTTDMVVVELPESSLTKRSTITVYSMQGCKLLQRVINDEARIQFSLSGKPTGVYLVQVQSGDKSEVARIIKTN